tara:strand:+ start:23419 stop:27117 length:3699 start_codon:yes stop_codon:yes gene_type:complete
MPKIDFNKMTIDNLREYLSKINESSKTLNSINLNSFKERKNYIEEQLFKTHDYDYDEILYPNMNDPDFNSKIFLKKEFNDLEIPKYTGTVVENIDKICESDFELAPHQIFVRNFLSFLTPYNSLLLYHGLGTGKTCSAISVCEEMRDYMKQIGIHKKIIIVASPNVQQNFKSQLFDDRKLSQVNGLWNLRGCTGSKFIKEINPMNMKGLTKEKVSKQVKKIINQYYIFMGYTEFSNYITRIKKMYIDPSNKDDETSEKIIKKSIEKEFSNRLIVIDEVHNIRFSSDNPKRSTAENLQELVKYSSTLKLLLLSATPMFNNAKEIVWLTNLMNLNDGRPPIKIKDVFDKDGSLKEVNGKEVGKELLLRKLRGYVSFLRGENPFSFPYRVYPNDFNPKKSIKNPDFVYPRYQINGTVILEELNHLDLYMTNIGETQKIAYQIAIKEIQKYLPSQEELDANGTKGLGWKQVGPPIQCLNMVYPSDSLYEFDSLSPEEKMESKLVSNNFVSTNGLSSVMDYNKSSKQSFRYKKSILEKYGRIFSSENIGKYSGKIKSIIDTIKKSKGIIIVYSQYIDGGCVPIALALEEAGITRYNTSKSSKGKSLFDPDETKDIDPIDANLMIPRKEIENKELFKPAKYVMITGDKNISPNNKNDMKAVTNDSNINGEDVKVVIISEAGSEGLDFNNVRQVHILEPWYNMSRIDQIIGRGVRFKSHCKQPIENRNVEIYLYGTNATNLIETDEFSIQKENGVEPIDMYIYRLAEYKAVQIGVVARILKENSVDCLLNRNSNSLTAEELDTILTQKMASGGKIEYRVGDKEFTQVCDYMEKCNYKCIASPDIDDKKVNYNTYDKEFIVLNTEKIVGKIKELYKERFIYSKTDLIKIITYSKKYPLIQIDNALQFLIDDKTEFLVDMFGRLGTLINIDNYYLFQPIELNDKTITGFRRRKPIEYKHTSLKPKMDKEIKEYVLKDIPKNKVLNVSQENVIINNIRDLYSESIIEEQNTRGKSGWHIFVPKALEILSVLLDVERRVLYKFIIHHYVDKLLFKDKKHLILYFVKKPLDEMDEVERIMNEYIKEKIRIQSDEIHAYLLSSNNKTIELWVYDNEKNDLVKGVPTDYIDYKDDLMRSMYEPEKLNFIVGFMSFINKTQEVIFKTKNNLEKRTSGARCDQAGKKNIIKTLNLIENNEIFTSANTRKIKTDILCVVQEILTRYYDDISKDDKKWFLNLELALFNSI